ncbi:hypothetical protein GCM10011611_63910 [Aliidongia dinghuensis]|uniref:Uncharacterized protein n=1 Tax=Aliidongia dinghuensis TaxID=1867774 RepID=A0A8J3E7S6_9PROT|nr:hypothetical protein [Aliidongia dinghuensis]GGF48745.1 hypothetical protein GCM10011611_63910 [Aliidongia dinghuensis]
MAVRVMLALVLALALSIGVASAATDADQPASLQFRFVNEPQTTVAAEAATAVPQAAAAQQSAAGTIIPLWTGSATGFGKPYTYTMVGQSPLVHLANPTSQIPTVVVPVRFVFETSSGNVVLDPTTPDPGSCLPAGQTALAMTLKSPVFQTVSALQLVTTANKSVALPELGSGQYADLFQRANFYSYTRAGALNAGYHVTLVPTVAPTVTITVPNANSLVSRGRQCATSAGYTLPTGLINAYALDSFLRTHVIPALSSHVSPKTFPIFLLYDVAQVWVNGSTTECCVLGDHNAYSNNGLLQTYAVADYETSGNYALASDVSILSREVMAWMDDPTVTNHVPAYWIDAAGTSNGCVAGLETNLPFSSWIFGPPLGQVAFRGYAFSVEEGVFHNWYFGASPSGAVNGWYSLFGSLTAPDINWTICQN